MLMSMSKFIEWVEQVDPYAVQRIALYKSLFIATVMAYVYWIFRPTNFTAFFSPFLLVRFYESPSLASFKEKEHFLIFIGVVVILLSTSFYLVYPFRVVFFFFSVIALTSVYFYVLKKYLSLKNVTMLIVASGATILSTEPPANCQIVYDIIGSSALSMIAIFICLRFFPNQYLRVWKRAMAKFIQSLELDIEKSFSHRGLRFMQEEMINLSVIRQYRRLIPKKYMIFTQKISINIRNIQFSLDNLYYEGENQAFWHEVKENLYRLRCAIKANTSCDDPIMSILPETKLQQYVMRCLQQAFSKWNQLCIILQH
ncbi:TPA: hypothetical protein JA995_10605 [Legionella pneumophila]|nr:hypothetical protein D7242_07075 [Legionella pneumophila]RYW25246.1 hypothetical protein D7234_12045 [Legionella pneumophila]HAT8586722.1 hypothetical protein [Legionella pneumophila]HAU1170513.1 hypothetical protein [Legionella pneumophila]HAU1574150.1 hypothetical protein [Legionella pneumophila]